ncbi:Gag-Pol polyprotein [Melipona quadrifasciata]|uniref:Gag-Pol polyprotein n=1 Tax=Melipona quadrifasciata TaxID=166423 RepID=A0A0N0U4D1_9HYME|nr:Gag-Pol polyprotein [Melipona quadrifasciata]
MQRNISVFDIRFALKQEIQRRERRKEELQSRDRESVRKIEGQKGNIYCYNCGIKGHMAAECNRNKRCFNCQRFNHIAAECREPRRNQPPMGRGQGGNFQMGIRGRIMRQHVGRSEIAMKTNDEAVISEKRQISLADKVAKITDRGYNVTFNKFEAIVYKRLNEAVMTAVRVKDSYYVKTFLVSRTNERTTMVTAESDVLGHANKEVIEEMKKED